jgi:hypothetical protein
MWRVFPLAFSVLLVACSKLSSDDATRIAAERLSAMPNGPSLRGSELLAALSAKAQPDGKYLVEMTDRQSETMWAVIVSPSGESEVSKMPVAE